MSQQQHHLRSSSLHSILHKGHDRYVPLPTSQTIKDKCCVLLLFLLFTAAVSFTHVKIQWPSTAQVTTDHILIFTLREENPGVKLTS
mmetsp:Transcript_9741/g.14642  ORF Transcript_9741/g.14642 Transcript_9741/m.14642 type:complete len:87 (-) Transcript_9741:842-1102(-)